MSTNTCLSFGELADYWTSDVDGAEAERIEAHLFSCAACARLLGDAERLRAGIRTSVRGGHVRAFVTDEVLNQLARHGVRIRMYTVAPGEAVQCAAWADDEVLVGRLKGDFRGLSAVDAAIRLETGEQWGVATDIPVPEGATELLLAWPADVIRAAPEIPMRVTLRPAGERNGAPIGEYIFDHRGTDDRATSP